MIPSSTGTYYLMNSMDIYICFFYISTMASAHISEVGGQKISVFRGFSLEDKKTLSRATSILLITHKPLY